LPQEGKDRQIFEDTFEILLSNADKIIAADAFLNNTSIELIKNLRPEDKPLLILNNAQPYNRTAQEFEDEDKPPYIKLKLDLDFATSMPKIKLFNKTEDGRELVNVESFKDVTDHIKYLTKVRFIISIDRLYLMKSQGLSKLKYGVFLKMLTAECENKKQEEKPETFNLDFLD
jgi:hypothetical protein